ncbi:MAG: RelA/SpoT domain-containing protein [Thermacetogeniaceae bacterium]
MNILNDQQAFLKKYHIDEGEYNRSGLKWDQLGEVYDAYLREMPQFHTLENYFSDCLKSVKNVHSVITRLKDPERLIEALIRKKISNQQLQITSKTYKEIIVDLIDITVLHLFQDDWEPIHEYITNKWNLKEKPIAFVREGDDRKLFGKFKRKGCSIQHHPYRYRSITYLAISSLDNNTNYIEILSRTIFEEGWTNIDRVIRDSDNANNPILMEYLSHFSHRTADMADEMGSFLCRYLNGEQGKNQIIESGPESRNIQPERENQTDEPLESQPIEPEFGSETGERMPSVLEDAQAVAGEHLQPEASDQGLSSGIVVLLGEVAEEHLPPEAGDLQEIIREGSLSVKINHLREQEVGFPGGDAEKTEETAEIKKDNYLKMPQEAVEALNNDFSKGPEDQKFNLSKLKQAIQGISPKDF